MKRLLILIVCLCLVTAAIAFVPGYPPVSHRFFTDPRAAKVDIMAHGAGQGVAPTNTMKALTLAHAQGADVLEVDVQLTRDGILILHHDDTLDRTTDMIGPVAQKTWAQIAQEDRGMDTKVARLDAALAAFPDARWNIEIKNKSDVAARVLCQDVTRFDMRSRVLVASFHDQAMTAFRTACPGVATSMATKEVRDFYVASQLGLSRFINTHAVAVQVPVTQGRIDLTNARFIAALKARNIKLHYWTINDQTEMRALIARGADGILTDYVTMGQDALKP